MLDRIVRYFAAVAFAARLAFVADGWTSRVELVLWFFSIPACVFLWVQPQPPGIASVILGGLAAIMAVLEMSRDRRPVAILLILALVVVELRSIYYDRTAQERQRVEDQKQLQSDFAKVLKENQDRFQKTEEHFGETLMGLSSVLKNMTESDAYPYVVPDPGLAEATCQDENQMNCPSVPLWIHNPSDYPITGVNILLVDGDYMGNNIRRTYSGISVVPPHDVRLLPGVDTKLFFDPSFGLSTTTVFLYTKSGTYMENIQFRKGVASSYIPLYRSLAFKFEIYRDLKNEGGGVTDLLLMQNGWSDDPATNRPAAPPPSPAPQPSPAGTSP